MSGTRIGVGRGTAVVGWWRAPAGQAFAALLLLWAGFLLYFRPASPFEWDEVLFMRAAERFDVWNYAPHAPGYPAYVGAVKLVHAIVGDPQLANQLAVIIASVLLVVLVARLLHGLAAPSWAALAAGASLAVVPALAFNANVGLSDVPGATAAVAATVALVRAWDEPRWAWLAGALAALTAGVRPQAVAALLPIGVALLARLAARRRWRALAGAACGGLAVSAACWVPTVLASGGLDRYLEAVGILREYVRFEEAGYRLPLAPWRRVVGYWLVAPFGSYSAAIAWWTLVALGAWSWWRAGRRRLVGVVGGATLSYLVVAAFSLNFTTAVRYVIPALPFAAMLAAGCTVHARRSLRAIGATLLGAWSVAVLAWGLPAYALRRQPAPVWESLRWAASHFDPATTVAVYDGEISPHAEWVLGRAGFTIEKARVGETYDQAGRPGKRVILAFAMPVPAAEVVHQRSWRNRRLQRLTRDRYYDAAILVAPDDRGVVVSTDFRVREPDWQLWSFGVIRLGSRASPHVARITAGDVPLTLSAAGARGRRLEPGTAEELLLWPGPAGALALRPPARTHARFPPVELRPAGSRDLVTLGLTGCVLPAVAHAPGMEGAFWHTDVALLNPHREALSLLAVFLPSDRDNHDAPVRRVEVAGGLHVFEDVVAQAGFVDHGATGAMLLLPFGASESDSRAFFALARTFNPNAAGPPFPGDGGMPGFPLNAGVAPGGSVRFTDLANDERYRQRTGILSLCPDATLVELIYTTEGGSRLAATAHRLLPFSHAQVVPPGQGRGVAVEVHYRDAPPPCRLFAYASLVERATGRVQHILPAKREDLDVVWPPLPVVTGRVGASAVSRR